MAVITFYEKTGCINNTKQKKLLALSGHTVNAVDLLSFGWTREHLLGFFNGLKVSDWFNQNAPDVYQGRVDPNSFSEESAIDAMMNNPLLIKRPLIEVDEQRIVGFEHPVVQALISSDAPKDDAHAQLLQENVTECPKKADWQTCD